MTSALSELNNDLDEFASLTPVRQAQIFACLNCLTEQGVLSKYISQLPDDYFTDEDGCSVIYEAARALLRLQPQNEQARVALSRLAGNEFSLLTRILASVQLGAVFLRVDGDLTGAQRCIELSKFFFEEYRFCSERYLTDLIGSRIARLAALHAFRAGDFDLAFDELTSSRLSAESLLNTPLTGQKYLHMIATENIRIVLEASMKADAQFGKVERFCLNAACLVEVDGEDPYVWNDIAMCANRLRVDSTAALARAGAHVLSGKLLFSDLPSKSRQQSTHCDELKAFDDILANRINDLRTPD